MSVEVVTFGCRLNGVESQTMHRAALAAGHDDLVIVNTCAVTAEAVRQARQTIRRLARERPGTEIVVTGCAAQIDPQAFAGLPQVTRVVENAVKTHAHTWASQSAGSSAPAAMSPTHEVGCVVGIAPEARPRHTRAFVEVQNGCDHRCTFCVIPFGRGLSRSTAVDEIVGQVRRLVDIGHREVVLTGVDITSYGADLPEGPGLGRLVGAILRAEPRLLRLRLSSLDAVEADDVLLDVLATDPRLMPHLHLSLQSGDDVILKRMKRRHLREDAIRFCDRVRRIRPDVVFGADLIAGFPTESDTMFERSLDLIADCGLTYLHIFPFSARPGTPAARMPALDGAVVRERARRLRETGEAALAAHLTRQVGRTLEVLVEQGGVGHTPDFTLVRVPNAEPGSVIDVAVTGHDGQALRGLPCDNSRMNSSVGEPPAE